MVHRDVHRDGSESTFPMGHFAFMHQRLLKSDQQLGKKNDDDDGVGKVGKAPKGEPQLEVESNWANSIIPSSVGDTIKKSVGSSSTFLMAPSASTLSSSPKLRTTDFGQDHDDGDSAVKRGMVQVNLKLGKFHLLCAIR